MGILCVVGNAFILTILVRIVMSWFPLDPDGFAARIFRFTISITEPVLGPIRRALPPVRMGAMALDLSPILVLIGGQIVLGLIGC